MTVASVSYNVLRNKIINVCIVSSRSLGFPFWLSDPRLKIEG